MSVHKTPLSRFTVARTSIYTHYRYYIIIETTRKNTSTYLIIFDIYYDPYNSRRGVFIVGHRRWLLRLYIYIYIPREGERTPLQCNNNNIIAAGNTRLVLYIPWYYAPACKSATATRSGTTRFECERLYRYATRAILQRRIFHYYYYVYTHTPLVVQSRRT